MKLKPAAPAVVLLPVFLLCLLLHWPGFTSWFRGDDFAWMGLLPRVHKFPDLLSALFAPGAQGTFRPWSERAFFLAGFGLFGMSPLPFRVVIFATQFANLALMMAIARRLTGSLAAAIAAAVFWIVNSATVEPLGWACVYNQVMAALFLLLALYCLLRQGEAGDPAAPAARRWARLEWLVFLLGFGAQELNLVYPALAAAYTLLCDRRRFRRTLPMFAVSILYVALHRWAAPPERTGDYAMHFTGSMLRGLAQYFASSIGPGHLWAPAALPPWITWTAVALLTLALLAFAVFRLRAGAAAGLFCLAWFVIALAPVLPLRDHRMEYYNYVPLIGLCWLGGWAVARAWRLSPPYRAAAAVLTLLYLGMALPRTFAVSGRNHRLTLRARDLVEGVAGAWQQHPGKAILLDGVDTDQFYEAVLDHPFLALGIDQVYLAPGSERRIDPHPDWGDPREFVLGGAQTANALSTGQLVVYDVSGPRLRNITSAYAARPRDLSLPLRVDLADPLAAWLLGPEWYALDGNHRWMPARATLRIGAPIRRGQQLYLHGSCGAGRPAEPVRLVVTAGGLALPPATVNPSGDRVFELAFPLPDALVGAPEMRVSVEVDRTFRPPSDSRTLGLAFGTFEVR